MSSLYPHVSDDLKAHALAITIGKYYNTAGLIQRISLEDWLAVLAVIVEWEIHKALTRYGEFLPTQGGTPLQRSGGLPLSALIETDANPPVLASQLILRWKQDRVLQERFPQFIAYSDWVESMLEGRQPMESALLP